MKINIEVRIPSGVAQGVYIAKNLKGVGKESITEQSQYRIQTLPQIL